MNKKITTLLLLAIIGLSSMVLVADQPTRMEMLRAKIAELQASGENSANFSVSTSLVAYLTSKGDPSYTANSIITMDFDMVLEYLNEEDVDLNDLELTII